VDNIHAHIPDSRKMLIQKTDHIPSMSKAGEFNRTVLDFLKARAQEIRA